MDVSRNPDDQVPDPPNGHVLSHASQFLPFLAESIEDELVFLSHTLDGVIQYVSPSASKVLGRAAEDCIGKSITELFSGAIVNAPLSQFPSDAAFVSGTCEMVGKGMIPINLKYFRCLLKNDGKETADRGPIGFVACFFRVARPVEAIQSAQSDFDKDILARVALLSAVERQVVEMVVDGNMNKKMASTLEVAVRTIESRRARAMAKLQTRSLSELVQFWMHVRRLESSGD